MNRLRNKLSSFMYGRYGVDELYIVLFVLYFVLFFINCFLSSPVLHLIAILAPLWAIFRSMSRNYAKRRRENETFLKFYRPARAEVVLLKDRLKDFKTARYRKCPHCRIVIRLPNQKGKHTVVCPKCRERMNVNIRI